jgi:hypothetical protein
LVLVAWFALITQVPTPVKLTTPAVTEQTLVAVESMVKVTALPEPPPVAVTVYVEPEYFALVGAVEVKVIA